MSPAVKVGLFAILALVIGAALILRIEDLHLFAPPTLTYEVRVDSAEGLEPKAPVRMSGVKVGTVRELRLENGQVRITLEVEPGTPIREGTTAGIESLGLLGEKHLELDPGPQSSPSLPEGSTIPGRDTADLNDALNVANEVGQDVREVTKNLRETLGGAAGQERMERIVENLAQLTERLATLVAQNQETAHRTMANLEAFSASARELADRLDQLAERNEGKVDHSLENIDALTERLRSAAEHVESIAKKVDEGEGTLGQLVESRETSDRLNETMASVKEGVDSLSGVFQQVVDTKLYFGLRGEYLTGASAGKGYVSLDVVPPHSSRFYRLEALSQPFGLRQLTTTTTTTTVDGATPRVELEVKERFRDRLAFSAMVGQRVGPLVLRAGVFESTGGAGVDVLLWKDRLRLTTETWDFGRGGPHPHLKSYANLYPLPYLYLTAGWDDYLNRDRNLDSFFVGGGTVWDAEDIKYFLRIVPVP